MDLPRILAFHGGGTNSNIFQAQCGALAKKLSSCIRFVFVQAPYSSHAGPDVARIFADMGPFTGWLPSRNNEKPKTVEEAVDRLEKSIATAVDQDNEIGATGEFIGLLGFSQGAKLCASILYTQQHRAAASFRSSALSKLDFRFGVLLAGRGPLIWLDSSSQPPIGLLPATATAVAHQAAALAPVTVKKRLTLPSLHVQGLKDPGLLLHRDLMYRWCEGDDVNLLEWEGNHRVPVDPETVGILAGGIRAIAREAGVLL